MFSALLNLLVQAFMYLDSIKLTFIVAVLKMYVIWTEHPILNTKISGC